MNVPSSRVVRALLGAALVLQSAACGTIMHPERKNQKSTQKIDVGVAVLDAIGLLFFIIPGVIAFAVDFSNNTIYLPNGQKGLLNLNDMEKLRFNPGKDAKAQIERLLRERTGVPVRLDDPGVLVSRLDSLDDLPVIAATASR